MEKILDDLIEAIKKEPCYQEFKKSEEKLMEEHLLLAEYRRVLDEYQDVKKYEGHIDITQTRQKLKHVQQRMQQSVIIQDYYTHYHHLNNFLSEMTALIFEDVADELLTSPYKLK